MWPSAGGSARSDNEALLYVTLTTTTSRRVIIMTRPQAVQRQDARRVSAKGKQKQALSSASASSPAHVDPEPKPVIDLSLEDDDDDAIQLRPRRSKQRQPAKPPAPVLVPGTIVPSPKTEATLLKPLHFDPVDAQVNNHWVYFFYRFCSERHDMYDRRQADVPRDQLSKDYTMTNTHIGNVYRQLDAGSLHMKTVTIANGDQSAEEVVCE